MNGFSSIAILHGEYEGASEGHHTNFAVYLSQRGTRFVEFVFIADPEGPN